MLNDDNEARRENQIIGSRLKLLVLNNSMKQIIEKVNQHKLGYIYFYNLS